MRIGLIADTHIPDHVKELPPQIKEIFRGVDLILHGGDVYEVPVLDELETIAPVLVARGDDDLEVLKDRRLKNEHILTIEGVTIWMRHQRPFKVEVEGKRPDVIIFGHTHKALLENSRGVLEVNPGSPAFPLYADPLGLAFTRYKNMLGTVALLTINSGKAEAEIIQLK